MNTLMMQSGSSWPYWQGWLTPEELRAITRLVWERVNPYGTYQLDVDARLVLWPLVT
jgi:hypothetical protein